MKKIIYLTQLKQIKNALIKLIGILLAILSAGLLGRYFAEVSTRPIADELTKLIVGIVIGLSIGVVVGILVRRAWGRLMGIVS
jgi:hypothetical protein